jgi:hypothetical protein
LKRRWVRRLRLWLLAAALLALPLYGPDLWVICHYHPQVQFDPIRWDSADVEGAGPTVRQRMIRDIVLRILPGKSRAEIEQLLGPSATHAGMRRYSMHDIEVCEKDEQGNWKPFPRTGSGHYYEEFDWDLLYYIGREQIFIFDHKGVACSPDNEVFIIRLDGDGRFSSWYIDGSTHWPRIVAKRALASSRPVAVMPPAATFRSRSAGRAPPGRRPCPA